MDASLTDRLRRAGYKLTAPRLAVLRVVEGMEEHLSYAEALDRGRTVYPVLGRATVYRTLDILTDLGVLRPVYLGDGSTYFARVDGGHHHLICLSCGTAIHFDECVVDGLEHALSERLGFQIQSHMLEFYGVCRDCRER
jgi:Fur family ferric uptake transcriptional regulator